MKSIIGSPGTGKTYTLESIIKEHNGDFIYLTYNVSMATQARRRIENDKKKVGTFHSILASKLGMTNWLTDEDYENFCKKYGLTNFKRSFASDEEDASDLERFLSWYDSTINAMRPPQKLNGDKLNMPLLYREYEKFKRELNKHDYTDILKEAFNRPLPYTDLLVVDEAQDLTKIMWQIIDKWRAGEKIIAGDDEQCIYAFRGVDVNEFINRVENPTILHTSKRFGEQIREVADRIIKPARRIPREYHGTGESTIGIERVSDFLKREGSKAILTRSNKLARYVADFLDIPAIPINPEHGLSNGWTKNTFKFCEIFRKYPNWSDQDFKEIILKTPAEIWARGTKTKAKKLHKDGDEVDVNLLLKGKAQVSLFSFELMKNKVDVDGFIQLLAVGDKQKRNIRRFYKQEIEPIYIDTFHAAKGLEYDNVLVALDFPSKLEFNDDERRILYTGVTRAKKHVGFYNFQFYKRDYEIWRYLS